MPFQDSPSSSLQNGSPSPDSHKFIQPLRTRRRISTRLTLFTILGLALLVLNVWSSIFSTPEVYASSHPPVVLKGSPSKPNHSSPTAGSTSSTSLYHPAPMGTAPTGKPQSLIRNTPMSMKADSFALSTTTTSGFVGSDGHFEVSIPADAITAQDLQQAGGQLRLQVSEIAPPSGSNAGGSGHLSLGTYLLQLVDAQGKLVAHGLRQPVTVKYHYDDAEAALNLDHAYLVMNGIKPQQGMKTALMNSNIALASTFGVRSTLAIQLQTAQHTLVATPLLSTPSSSLTWQSEVSVGTFGKPDPFNVDLSAGGLTSQLPIDVPAGPGGLTPPVSLTYSSEGVNNQHNPTGAAGWVGEGWNLSMGSINWAEHNVDVGCTTCGGVANWESTWELSDPYGTSSELIPPNLNVSTYYDDSTNTYCDAASGTNAPYPCPILWHTATETHTKIYAYVGPNSLPDQSAKPPCFRVWHANGIMEEFGCTPDSLQHYYQASVGAHLVSSWLLDMITDPQGNQIHLTYQQDNTTVAGTHQAVRDVALSTIEYDSPNCHNAQTMCTGSNWNPLIRLSFQANHAPRVSGVGPSGCNGGANLRCDDPLDLSGSGGIAAPEVQSTFVLNDILVQVRSSSSASWNSLHDYRLSYEESGPSTITDPLTNKSESVAGMLDLTRFQDIGTVGANALMYSGLDNDAASSYAYMKVFDLSSKNVTVGPNTTLSYWIFPQSNATNAYVSGNNSSCVAVDMIFTDGTNLRDSGAVDQNGNKLHPSNQCGHLTMDQWNLVTANIGAVRNGKTISKIDIGYDQGPNTGGYRGYLDDISVSNPNSNVPLFSSTFESGDPQPNWTNTVDSGPEFGAGNIRSVGGICCGSTTPEAGLRSEVVHADSAALPIRTFSYTTVTNYYEDDQYSANASGISKCGPSWNTGNGSGCLLWSQSYANNSRFLSSVSNGQGLAQSFGWMVARSNTHGVPGGGANNADPFYCNSHQSGYPCNEADDQSWSHVVLTQTNDTTVRVTQNGQGGTQTSTPITTTTGYGYQLTYPLASQQCSDCVAGFYWGNQNDSDYLSYYNNKFMGFAQATVSLPSGAREVHKYYATQGIGIYDTNQVSCFAQHPCHASPWWNLNNAAHGHEYQAQYYDTDGTTLLKQTNATYTAVCPPAGVAATPAGTSGGKTYTWDGNLVSELDHNNPVAVCDIQQTQSVASVSDGSSNSVTTTSNYSYDSYGRMTKEATTSNGGTPNQVVKNMSYVWNDGVTATRTSATGTYIIDTPAFEDTEDGAGNRLGCSYTNYDGQSYATGQTSGLTIGHVTSKTSYNNCGTSSNGYTPSGPSTTTIAYDAFGNDVGSSDADANAGISGHTGCTVGSTTYTSCTAYDSTFDALQTGAANALNQHTSTSYANTTALFGYGTWPASSTDANNQTTNVNYDSLGRMTSEALPGETNGLLTNQWSYTNWCSGTAAQAPCEEIDQINRLDNNTTTITRAFYDGMGRLIETRAPGPNAQDVVTYAYYDTSGRQIFKSNPYFVAAYTGPTGPAGYSLPDSTQPGTSTTYTNLRVTSVTDPNSHTSTSTDSVVCGVAGTSDTGCYGQVMVQDANGHQAAALTGGLGKTNYKQTYTGTSGSYALYATTTLTYNAASDLLSTKSPDGTTVTTTYDALGRAISQQDPDSGTSTVSYDPNGNVTETVDARGSAGTVYAGYDGLNRQLWRNSTNSATGAWIAYSYDNTANGNNGVSQLTGESFTGSGNLSGSYAYTYDARGQQTNQTTTINGTQYAVQATYNDAGQLLTQQYPTGETVTPSYSSTGWLTGLNTSAGGSTALASNLAYTGLSGAAGRISSMSLDNGTYSYTASYDTGIRLTSAGLSTSSGNNVLYQTQPTYDAVSNVVGVQTSVGGQTDTQQFCYDDLNRLTWAGTNGTPPCSGQSITAGTLTAAQYQQSTSYNVDGGLITGPSGTYTYGDSSHPHAVTSTSKGYSASYDASGNMICRATTTATTCSGSSPTGQQLSYDAEGRLSLWQNQPSSPTQTVNYLYDGSGNRVAMQSTVNGTTTLTSYIGSIEEVQTSGSTTQTTTYYAVEGKRVAADVNGTFSYFGYDALGSQVAVLDASGHLVGAQLYSPYGNSRYNNGTLPTSIGFTGQRADSVTGLDYYVARYYDPGVGQFLSADSVQGNAVGMDPYAYVGGNPETRTDPTGKFFYNPGSGEGARFVSGSRTPVTFYYTEPVRTTYSLQPTYPRTYSGGYGVNVDGLNTGNNVASAYYGGWSGGYKSLIRGLREYADLGKQAKNASPTLKNLVKPFTGGNGKITIETRQSRASQFVDTLEENVGRFDHIGNGLLIAGAILDGISSGTDFYQHHPKYGVAASVGYAAIHAAATTAGAYWGAQGGMYLGAAIGTALCPGVGTVVGGFVGAAVGGWAGGWAAGWAVDTFVGNNIKGGN